MVLDYQSAGTKRPFNWFNLIKLVVGVAMLLLALWLVRRDAKLDGYLEGYQDATMRYAPAPTPLSELAKRFPPTTQEN